MNHQLPEIDQVPLKVIKQLDSLKVVIKKFLLGYFLKESDFTKDELKNIAPSNIVIKTKRTSEEKFNIKVQFILDRNPDLSGPLQLIPAFQIFCLIINQENVEYYKNFLKGVSTKIQCKRITKTLATISDLLKNMKGKIKEYVHQNPHFLDLITPEYS